MNSPKRKPTNQQLLSKKWQVISLCFALLLMFGLIAAISHWSKELDRQEINHQAFVASEQSKIPAQFQAVLPNEPINLQRDLQEHPRFHHEVWRYGANLKGDNGKEYSVQWTLYRIANGDHQANGWQNPQIYTAQTVVSTREQVWSDQRAARGGIGQAGVVNNPFRMWVDNWQWQSKDNSGLSNHLIVKAKGFSVDLTSLNFGDFVANGKNGYKKIAQSQAHGLHNLALYSFSAPFMEAKGELILDGKHVSVQGLAWLDKEWGNHLTVGENLRWDDFIIHLQDGRSLKITQYHHMPQQEKFVVGTLSNKSGKVTNIDSDDIHINSLEDYQLINGRFIPLRWVIEIPKYNINLITQFYNQQMWFPFWLPSWEGAISVTGSQKGIGFMQLTGY